MSRTALLWPKKGRRHIAILTSCGRPTFICHVDMFWDWRCTKVGSRVGIGEMPPISLNPLVFNLHTSFLCAYETVVTGSFIDYGRGKSQNKFVKPRELIKVWKMYTSWTKFHVNTKNWFICFNVWRIMLCKGKLRRNKRKHTHECSQTTSFAVNFPQLEPKK